MRFLVLILGLWAVSAWADDLPTNLLLQCEGKRSVTMNFEGTRPKFINDKFETMLRLKDGELSFTDTIWMTTKGCILRNGIVRCTAKSVVASGIDSGSERRELESFITRETGEFNFFLKTWSFSGPNASGKQIGTMLYRLSGICRPVSNQLF